MLQAVASVASEVPVVANVPASKKPVVARPSVVEYDVLFRLKKPPLKSIVSPRIEAGVVKNVT